MKRTTAAIPPETAQLVQATLNRLEGVPTMWGRRFGGALTASDVTREALARGLRSIDQHPQLDPALIPGLVSETRTAMVP